MHRFKNICVYISLLIILISVISLNIINDKKVNILGLINLVSYHSKNVGYSNSSKTSKTNVQDALNELYTKIDSLECKGGYTKSNYNNDGYFCKKKSSTGFSSSKNIKLSSKDVLYTYNNQNNVQDALDNILSKVNSIGCKSGYLKKNETTDEYYCERAICKRATILHTEVCNQSNENFYCSGDGYTTGSTITYGSKGTKGILKTGDAFDCDINWDGTYNSSTERFYYVSTLSNGITKNDNVAALIYYNSVVNGVSNKKSEIAYDLVHFDTTTGHVYNNYGPVTAVKYLPTTTQWKKIELLNTKRQITNENGGTTTTKTFDKVYTYNLPIFDYSGYAARFLTYQEVYNGCYDGVNEITTKGGLSNKCKFLFENTRYAVSTPVIAGYWLETPMENEGYAAHVIMGDSSMVYKNMHIRQETEFGVRPVIEISKLNIEY